MNHSLCYKSVNETLFMIEDRLTSENEWKFLLYLDRFDDFAGKHLLKNLDDFREHEGDEKFALGFLEQIKSKLIRRLDQFLSENKIDGNKEYINAMEEKELREYWDKNGPQDFREEFCFNNK